MMRICHSIKNIRHFIITKLSNIKLPIHLIGLGIASLLASAPLHADLYSDYNVAGDKIIILKEDTFKPVPSHLFGDAANTNSEATEDGLDATIASDDTANQASDIVSADRDDLWQRIKNGYAMPESTSSLTTKHENWYSSRPEYINRMVERSQRYLFHIVEEVEKRGMPTEIALLPMIESAFNPQAYSTSRASGIWQFIPSTGRHFGLKQNWWFDNRRNIMFATDAALTYLQKLHAMFGAWDLALAAYNAGEGTVGRAIERNRKRGLPTDYESLDLPVETRNYVPKLQAIKNLMTNPGNYGLTIPTIANTPYFAKVSAPAQIDATLAAKLAEISDEEFLALNPSYNRPVITNDGGNHELLLPIVSAQTFKTNLANHDKPLVSWKTYLAKRGERMDKIARKFGIQLAQLRDVNNLPTAPKFKKTTTILVPNGNRTDFNPSKAASLTPAAAIEPKSELNIKQEAYNIDLANTDDNTRDQAKNSQVVEFSTQRNITHKVKKGERMQSIAKRYGVSVKQIMAENSLKTHHIKAGQLLNISSKGAGNVNKNVARNNKNIPKEQIYIVKLGDTLHGIAEKFDVAIADLKRWNKKTGDHIRPGHKLTIKQSDDV